MTTTVHFILDVPIDLEVEDLDGYRSAIDRAKEDLHDTINDMITYEDVAETALTILIQDPEYQNVSPVVLKSAIGKKIMDEFLEQESDEAGLWSGI